MSLPGCLGPGISNVNIKFSFTIHSHGGKLYVTKITGQQLYLKLRSLKGLNPSDERPNLRFRGSDAKEGHLLLIVFHANESTGCRILLS